ncbi:MAG: hypothetical protein NTX46_00265 [Chloroflexi bacterium]|nr:hypothetical protein [Chloroflexota bacterium]
MKNTSKSRSLIRSLGALFAPNKQLSPNQRVPDTYYKMIWFDKQMFAGIDFVSKAEKISKKKAARKLIELGYSKYMGDLVREAAKTEIVVDGIRRKTRAAHAILLLRKLAKEHGFDIKGFI